MNSVRFRALFIVLLLLPLDLVVTFVILIADLVLFPLRMVRRRPTSFMPADVSSVTIQMLNWDGQHLLKESLPAVVEAVRRSSHFSGLKHEILVVDNGSHDGSVGYIQEQFPDVRVLALDRNYGFSIGNNKGFHAVHSDVVVLLNNDMVAAPDFLQALLSPFKDPEVFAVSSQIFFADPGKRREETGKTMGKYERGFFEFWHAEVLPADERLAAIPILWAGGGSCAIDTRKLRSMGGFDSLYHPFYVEDTDIGWQAWKRGWKCLFAPQSHVVHKHRGTSRPKFGDEFVNSIIRRNQFLFIWKNITEPGLILEHLLGLPRTHGRAILQKGVRSEIRSYVNSVVRLPLAIWRRVANLRDYVVSDSAILRSLR